LVEVVLEVVALDVLHDQEGDVAVAVGVVDADDVGVLQPRRRARLGAEAVLVFGGGFFREVFDLDGLDGDAPVQVGVAPLVHHAHGTLAQDPEQIVPSQLFESHGQVELGEWAEEAKKAGWPAGGPTARLRLETKIDSSLHRPEAKPLKAVTFSRPQVRMENATSGALSSVRSQPGTMWPLPTR
jgi:hypothetical protein